MNLKIYSSTVVFSCESYEIFKNTYFVEHRRTVASVIDIDQNTHTQVNTSINSAEKPGYQLQQK